MCEEFCKGVFWKGADSMRIRMIEPVQSKTSKRKRACAYARVSTDSRKQGESLENQISSYERSIKANPEYEFVGVFADKGISGYNRNRPEFQRMVQMAREGLVDLIITKAISRFARNTAVLLEVVRELRQIGVAIYFEAQNINTLSGDGEVMLTVLASFAEEESRNVSENRKWSIQKKFERGEYMINTERFLGYDKDASGELVINHKEAVVVRFFADMYLLGVGSSRLGQLADFLGIPTVTGGKWAGGAFMGMFRNEKYKGDFLLQKYYTPEDKRNQSVRNKGEVQSYYMEDSHPAILSTEIWDALQKKMEENKRGRNIAQGDSMKYQNRYPLTGMLYCPFCGKKLRRRQGYKKKVEWLCITYIEEGKQACPGVRIPDESASRKQIIEPTVAEEVYRDGKKHYRYTSKEEFDKRGRETGEAEETAGSSVLQGEYRPRRAAIKL